MDVSWQTVLAMWLIAAVSGLMACCIMEGNGFEQGIGFLWWVALLCVFFFVPAPHKGQGSGSVPTSIIPSQ